MPIAVLTPDGTVLVDTLARPMESIPADARAIHGISAATVAGAPPFPDLYPQLRALLAQRTIVPYNVAFDRGILAGVLARPQRRRWTCRWHCALDWWAAYVGEWSDYWDAYRWQPLPGGDHTARGDCRAMRALQQMVISAGRVGEKEQDT